MALKINGVFRDILVGALLLALGATSSILWAHEGELARLDASSVTIAQARELEQRVETHLEHTTDRIEIRLEKIDTKLDRLIERTIPHGSR